MWFQWPRPQTCIAKFASSTWSTLMYVNRSVIREYHDPMQNQASNAVSDCELPDKADKVAVLGTSKKALQLGLKSRLF